MLEIVQRLANRIGLTMTRCPVCGVMIDTPHHNNLCPTCADAMQPKTNGYCSQCGIMFGRNDNPPTICAQCRHTPPPWDTLHFHGSYAGKLRELILSYKFNNGFGRTHLLASMARQAFNETARIPDIIIPVPLHTRRLLWRGFNQSTELARILGKKLNRPVLTNGLTRIRHTIPQTRLGLTERQVNIKDAFAAEPDKVQGLTALIVDDVYTTGSTLSECARTLKRAGVVGVDVLVLARAQQ